MKITFPLYEVLFSRELVYISDFRFLNFAEAFFLKITKLKMFSSFFSIGQFLETTSILVLLLEEVK